MYQRIVSRRRQGSHHVGNAEAPRQKGRVACVENIHNKGDQNVEDQEVNANGPGVQPEFPRS